VNFASNAISTEQSPETAYVCACTHTCIKLWKSGAEVDEDVSFTINEEKYVSSVLCLGLLTELSVFGDKCNILWLFLLFKF
jgi:hypothetical protein